MDATRYTAFANTLRERLAQDASALGLVALGSMAQQDYGPDQWSDHDFFVVVESGTQARFRADLGWLPDAARIIFAYQETAHGLKVVYDDGHLLEFAVFDLDELNLARVNRFRVLLDRSDVTQRIAAVAARTAREGGAGHDDRVLLGNFLANLLVGVGRHRRGDRLSGRRFVCDFALGHLLALLAKHLPAPQHALLDNFDTRRRFEQVYPALGAELHAIIHKNTETAALALVELAERELLPRLPQFPRPAVAVLRAQLQRELE
jgi:hypothetical protein